MSSLPLKAEDQWDENRKAAGSLNDLMFLAAVHAGAARDGD
jgi:hypothetical protein